jgi:Rrf2 family protein
MDFWRTATEAVEGALPFWGILRPQRIRFTMRLGRASAYGMLAMMSIAQTSVSSARSKPNGTNGHHRHRRTNGRKTNGHAHPLHIDLSAKPQTRARQISQTTGIPIEYLRKVLQRLTRARLVDSERGRGGGFKLARDPSKITLLHIVEAIEGPVDEAAFLGDSLLAHHQGNEGFPRLREWRRHTAEGVRELLDAQSLEDLMH